MGKGLAMPALSSAATRGVGTPSAPKVEVVIECFCAVRHTGRLAAQRRTETRGPDGEGGDGHIRSPYEENQPEGGDAFYDAREGVESFHASPKPTSAWLRS